MQHAFSVNRSVPLGCGRQGVKSAALRSAASRSRSSVKVRSSGSRILDTRSHPEIEPWLTQVTLRKPLGVVFAESPDGKVVVESLAPGGNAEKSGQVRPGDVLVWCSAVVLKAETEGLFVANDHDSVLLDHVQRTMFDCRGQDFKTVMGALHSNLSRWGVQDVTLVLQWPDAEESVDENAVEALAGVINTISDA